MQEVLVNHLGGLSLPRNSVVRLTEHPDMTIDVYGGRKTTQYNIYIVIPCQKHLAETVLMRGDNICFIEKYEKSSLIYPCHSFLS